ncbi:hypothetical protein FA13DRAFT_686182 [Coprinellus micaceus]|uniref:Uncharacterized protein n=1 Tax=Coprinellus micaceus TaxID=71717 RepID=A0A4Y7T4D9_COPMI|nr:hypothetical protein FA13DRAFT_686182 [Coprinellus micaceus]
MMDTNSRSQKPSYTVFDLLRLPSGQTLYPARHIAAISRSDATLKGTVIALRDFVVGNNDPNTAVEELFKEDRGEEEARTLAHICLEISDLLVSDRLQSASAFRSAVCSVALSGLYKSWASASEATYISAAQVERLIFVSALCADLYVFDFIPRPTFLQSLRRTNYYAARTKNLDIMAMLAAYLLSRACTSTNPPSVDAGKLLPAWVWAMFLGDFKHIVRLNERNHITASIKRMVRYLGFSDAPHVQYETLRAFARNFTSDPHAIPEWYLFYPSPADLSIKVEKTCQDLSKLS